MDNYDIVVIGAGHAGIEAAMASARMGCKTLLITLDAETIGLMSCNPAIGGVGKGQLVKEIDALGGQMGLAADNCGIQFRILNSSKGAAVQSSRAQIDMHRYSQYMIKLTKRQENLSIKEAEVKKLIVEDNKVKGVVTDKNEEISAQAIIISPGTFLDGLIHLGLKHFKGGRLGEPAAVSLAENLKELGFSLLRFKTGTCPRLDKKTIDFSRLIVQNGDEPPRPFSSATERLTQKQIPCYITYTNKDTHQIIRNNLDRSPLYAGIIKSVGVRYCPSIEDKVVKFADRQRHQIFLEPEGLETDRIYPNGLSTSLPEDVQLEIIHSIEGLEKAEVIRFGYGIEHTVVEPTQLYPSLEAKMIQNLYLAGQINGTTGYEEAAAQGLIAGINASLRVRNREPLILDRSSSYIGVLIDDLTTKGTNEPYRMFTSRVEYRLLLREDNADLRLRKIGFNLGLVSRDEYQRVQEKAEAIKEGIDFLKKTRLKPPAVKKPLSLEELLKQPQISIEDLKDLLNADYRKSNADERRFDNQENPRISACPANLSDRGRDPARIELSGRDNPRESALKSITLDIPEFALRQVEIEVKYSGFIQRQLKDVERFKNLEKIKLPASLDYPHILGLSKEIREKLNKFKPINLGQASRISGVTPVAISLLVVYLKKFNEEK